MVGDRQLDSGARSADPGQMIQETVAVAPGLAGQVAPGDRLIIKLCHPGDGVELDAKYRIVDVHAAARLRRRALDST